jgi:hypothetical protein
MKPICEDIVIYQGATWNPILQWLQEAPVQKPITGVTLGLPTQVVASAHGITGTARVPVWITGVDGTRGLNTTGYRPEDAPLWATVVDADTLAVDFDSSQLRKYASGGVLTYYPPVDLSTYTAREEIRDSIAATDALVVTATGGQGITLGTDGTIARVLTAAQTAALPLTASIHMLELTDPNGVVTRFSQGRVSVCPGFPAVSP